MKLTPEQLAKYRAMVDRSWEAQLMNAYADGRKDGREEVAIAMSELLAALRELLDCPFDIDSATVPKAGIDAAPEQVVGTMSVALLRYRRARAAIAKATGATA